MTKGHKDYILRAIGLHTVDFSIDYLWKLTELIYNIFNDMEIAVIFEQYGKSFMNNLFENIKILPENIRRRILHLNF